MCSLCNIPICLRSRQPGGKNVESSTNISHEACTPLDNAIDESVGCIMSKHDASSSSSAQHSRRRCDLDLCRVQHAPAGTLFRIVLQAALSLVEDSVMLTRRKKPPDIILKEHL